MCWPNVWVTRTSTLTFVGPIALTLHFVRLPSRLPWTSADTNRSNTTKQKAIIEHSPLTSSLLHCLAIPHPLLLSRCGISNPTTFKTSNCSTSYFGTSFFTTETSTNVLLEYSPSMRHLMTATTGWWRPLTKIGLHWPYMPSPFAHTELIQFFLAQQARIDDDRKRNVKLWNNRSLLSLPVLQQEGQ
jgi:hypothetical protein